MVLWYDVQPPSFFPMEDSSWRNIILVIFRGKVKKTVEMK